MTWWWPFGHLVVVQLLCHIFLVKQRTPSHGRCLLKLPDTVNQELLQSTSSQNQQIIYREPGSAHKEPATKESHPCAPSWASTEPSPAAEIKRIPASITLSGTHLLHSSCIFYYIPSVLFSPSSLFHLFSTKESRSHKAKQSQEKLTALTPPSPHTSVYEQLLNTGLAESPNRQNSFHYLFLVLFYSTKIILTFLSQEE